MNEGFERELKKTVKPYLDSGRSGDYKHTLRAVGYGRELLQHEEGEEGIVIPSLYPHDIGWGEVNFEDFINITSPSQKKDAAAHLREGLKRWFKTRKAKHMALQLAKESGLCEDAGYPIMLLSSGKCSANPLK